jgi:hypothetical protein
MHPILDKLGGGDRRSIGRSNEVVAEVLAHPRLFDVVFSGMLTDDPLIRMRSADAIEKITACHPEYLRGFRSQLIDQVAQSDQQEVRWHVAQMLPRVEWGPTERRQVLRILREYLNDRSSIVRTFAMQALADLARKAPHLRPSVLRRLRPLTARGTPAMKARGRKLLAELDGRTNRPSGTRRKRRAG